MGSAAHISFVGRVIPEVLSLALALLFAPLSCYVSLNLFIFSPESGVVTGEEEEGLLFDRTA